MSRYPVTINDIRPGITFHYKEDSSDKFHLYIVVTEPDDINGNVCIVSVNITTKRNRGLGADKTVVLEVGDHPFINRSSVIVYRMAAFFSVETLISHINQRRTLGQELDAELLKRIQKGLLDSEFTPEEIREYCENIFDL